MIYTKLCLLAVILATWAAAFRDRSLPYFPIEISRTATGSLSRWVFRLGVLAGSAVMHAEADSFDVYITWAGLLLLAWFDDLRHFELHMAGVAVMTLGVGIRAVLFSDTANTVPLFVCAAVIYALRVVIKVATVLVLELKKPLDSSTMVELLFNAHDCRTKCIDHAKRIMYYGESSADAPETTRFIFSICGVLQWLVFFVFSLLY